MSDKLSFDIQELAEVGNAVLVSMSGAIDASTVISFQTTLEKLQLRGITRFILDMEGIRYVNSTGLGSLVRLADQLESDGGGFALVKIHPKVKVVFDMLGLNAFFKIFNSKDEAVDYFSNSSPKVKVETPGSTGKDKVQVQPLPKAPAVPSPQTQRKPSAPPVHEQPKPQTPFQQQPSVQEQPRTQGPYQPQQPPVQEQQKPQMPFQQQPPVFQMRTIACQNCGVTLKISQPGSFRCSRCYNVFTVQPTGQVQFQVPTPKSTPLQMNLTCKDETREALLWFLAAIAKYHSFTPQRIQQLQAAVNEVIIHITRDAYNNNQDSTYSVLIAAMNNEVNLKFADHGRTLPQNNPNFFKFTKQVMRIFDLKKHPQAGNIITLKMTAF